MAGYYCFTLVLVCPFVGSSVRPSVRLSNVHPSVFSFTDDNLSKMSMNFTKLGMCTDNVDVWFEIANRQISSIFEGVIWPRHVRIFV